MRRVQRLSQGHPSQLWWRFLNRFRNRPDSEHEQAIVRIAVACAVLIYLELYGYFAYGSLNALGELIAATLGFLAFALVLLGWIGIAPGRCLTRRIIGMLADLNITSLLMAYYGEPAAPLYSAYLWVTVGNGLRYGQVYLLLSTLISVAGFIGVIYFNPYWAQQPTLGWGLAFGLFVMPLYFGALLHKLTQARAEAEQANRAKTQFLANISHELRTPLNGVVGVVDLLKGTPLTPLQRHFIKTIQTSSEALLGLIEDILDVSKIEAGKTTLQTKELDLHALINSTVGMLAPQAKRKDLAFHTYIDPHVPYRVCGDELRLRQILINLLNNAIKFTEQGGIEVNVWRVQGARDRVTVQFEVRDTGVGIPAEFQDQVFDPFAQVDTSHTRQYGGAGLGTAIAKELVELMGGTIELESEPGVGTTFYCQLPLAKQAEGGSLDETLPVGSRVLVLSDDAEVVTSLQHWLQGWGLSLEVYRDAAACEAALERAGPAQGYGALLVDEGCISDPTAFALNCGTQEVSQSLQLVLIHRDPETMSHQSASKAGYSALLSLPLEKTLVFNALHALHGPLPAADQGVIPLRSETSTRSKPTRDLHVLVAEDNAVNQEVIRLILEREGCVVSEVSDGEQALDALEQRSYDLVIIDMHMPSHSGLDVIKMYRFMATEKQSVPFLVLTADATAEAARACEEAGAEAYLTKPIEADRLLEAIDRLTGTTPVREATETGPRERPTKEPPSVSEEDPNVTVDGRLVSPETMTQLAELASDPHFLSELIHGFLNDSRERLTEMEAALDEDRPSALQEHAHALRGSAGSLGVEAVANVCARIESRSTLELTAETTREELVWLRELLERAQPALLVYTCGQMQATGMS